MVEETNTKEKQANTQPEENKKQVSGRGRASGKRARTKNRRKSKGRRGRPRSEFDHRVVDIRRVARVMAGGRRFSFSATLIAGDRKGRVGVGVGKALDTATAIDKAIRNAKRNMCEPKLTKDMSIPHEVEAKYTSAKIILFPTPGKGGITAGGSVRTVLELAGIKDVGAKILSRSKNKMNNARAAIEALKKLRAPMHSDTKK